MLYLKTEIICINDYCEEIVVERKKHNFFWDF